MINASGLLFFLATGAILSNVYGAKILLMPFAHNSHVNMFLVAGKVLQKAGHDVTVLVPDKFVSKVSKTKVNCLVFELKKESDFAEAMATRAVELFQDKVGHLTIAAELKACWDHLADDMLSNTTMLHEIESAKFDLALIDGFPSARFYYLIAYKFGIPYITLTAAYDPWGSGVSALPSTEPGQLLLLTPDMTFFQRIQNFVVFFVQLHAPYFASYISDTTDFAPEKEPRTLQYLYSHSEMFLVNLETNCGDYPRTSAPHFRFISGASAHPPEPLPADILDFLGDAKDGIVVVSFGSLKAIRMVLPLVMNKLFDALGRLEQKVIFSYNPKELKDYNVPKNLMAINWMPQNDLLGHNKTKLFVTHAGNNGQLESIFHGVPMLAIPFDGDQQYNALRAQYHGFGETLDMKTLTADEMFSLMQKIIASPTYSQKVQKCSRIIKSMPTPQETIVFWVNHILEFGGSHLQPISIDMPLYKMLMIDVGLFVLFCLFVLMKLTSFLVRRLCTKCCSSRKVKRE